MKILISLLKNKLLIYQIKVLNIKKYKRIKLSISNKKTKIYELNI